MAYSPKEGLIDLYGGQGDLEKGIIKCVGEPEKRFDEDALRILRGLRFSSCLGFEIEEKTSKAILEQRELLKSISAERIASELKKLLCGKGVRKILLDYREVIAVFIPELRESFDFRQNNPHHFLDVYGHICLSVENVRPQWQMRLTMLLHDIGKALDHEMDGSHVELGVEAAKKYRESEGVIHAIQAHHGDVEAKTLVACLVQAADAVSASRPGARRENVQNYIKRLEKLESIASSFEGVERSFAIQAGREVRIMVKPEVVSDEKMVLIARDIVKKIEDELEYPGQIKVNIIRESRVSDYAK